MKVFKSSIYGSVAEPESLGEVLDLATKPIEGVHYNVHMWRGQANIDWLLHSGAYRRLALTKERITEYDLRSYEKSLLAKARFNNFHIVDGRELPDFDLLARLQHHGAATRLFDTSRNCLVALYFACSSHPDDHGLVTGFHSHNLGGYEGQGEYRPYEQVVADASEHDHPQTWSPPLVSPRIAAQHSQFIYSKVSSNSPHSLNFSIKENAFLPIAISPILKAEALKLLSEVFDIRQSTLFPDLSGFCEINNTHTQAYADHRW
ncbi:FRG domain-containing protein [Xanthomonas sp. NCPPB 1068]|uniref:FRG domain-containing protein n=1 Tax=Xanthomonas sp. NCPPB 1068 TaxID=487525 RepID=UPI003558A06B